MMWIWRGLGAEMLLRRGFATPQEPDGGTATERRGYTQQGFGNFALRGLVLRSGATSQSGGRAARGGVDDDFRSGWENPLRWRARRGRDGALAQGEAQTG